MHLAAKLCPDPAGARDMLLKPAVGCGGEHAIPIHPSPSFLHNRDLRAFGALTA